MFKNQKGGRLSLGAVFSAGVLVLVGAAQAQLPRYDHVVVLMEENHNYDEIIGQTDPATGAPYLNSLAGSGALFTNSHGVEHPSQPNYLDLYSGFNQGLMGSAADNQSPLTPFTSANLGASLIQAGYTFSDFSEGLPYSLPSDRMTAVPSGTAGATPYGFLGATDGEYAAKHNPSHNWQNDANPTANQLSSTTNQPFTAFPTTLNGNFASLPTVSFVIPNLLDDMHDGTVNQGDVWAQANISAYQQWAQTHNSLLIVTWDENDESNVSDPTYGTNQIATIFSGQGVIPGQYNQLITHFNVLKTIEDMYGLPASNAATDGTAADITAPFSIPEPSSFWLLAVAGMVTIAGLGIRRSRACCSRLALPRRSHLVAISAACLLGLSARAATVISPNSLPDPNDSTGNSTLPASQTYGDTPNDFPFFPGAGTAMRYQQVYSASDFSAFAAGGENIVEIAFRVSSDAPSRTDKGAFTSTIANLSITMSTTAATPDNLSPTFAANSGADAVTVYGNAVTGSPLTLASTGAAASGSAPAPFDAVIVLTTPFYYNPAAGNLLLDIRNFSGGTTTPDGIQLDGTMVTGDTVSSQYNYGSATAAAVSQSDGVDNDVSTEGLVTQFLTIPEPGTLSMATAALPLLSLLLIRRLFRRPQP